MTSESLVGLPLPFVLGLMWACIAVLVRRLDLGEPRAPWFFCGLFALFALQSFLVGLRFGYGEDRLILVQRILPLLTGPMMYLAFLSLSVPADQLRRSMGLHLGAVLIAAAGFQLMPRDSVQLDLVIGASYFFYAAGLLLLWRKGPDSLIHAHLNLSPRILLWMLWGVGFLILLLATDSAIAVSFALQKGGQALSIISYGSVLLIPVVLALFTFLPPFLKARPAPVKLPAGTDSDTANLEAEARAMLTATRLYLEPDLSVQRLARRLHVPVRALSLAINESQGMNVSQYVNGFRLAQAAALLRETDESVAKVMAQSGFLTRSNFYREFQRVYGQSPAAYRQTTPD